MQRRVQTLTNVDLVQVSPRVFLSLGQRVHFVAESALVSGHRRGSLMTEIEMMTRQLLLCLVNRPLWRRTWISDPLRVLFAVACSLVRDLVIPH